MSEDKKQTDEEVTKDGAVEIDEDQLDEAAGGASLSFEAAIKFSPLEPAIKFSPDLTQPAIKFSGDLGVKKP